MYKESKIPKLTGAEWNMTVRIGEEWAKGNTGQRVLSFNYPGSNKSEMSKPSV